MANTIQVTACDNELIVLAYQSGASFELCQVLSGNLNTVSVTLTINAGTNTGTQIFNGTTGPLNITASTNLTSGQYSLLILGINWSGQSQFTVVVDGTTYSFPLQQDAPSGLVWNPGPISITV